MWIWFLAGILIWQVIIFIVDIISDENEELMCRIGMLLPWLIASGFISIVRNILKYYVKHNYILYNIYNAKAANEKVMYLETVRVKNGTDNNYYQEGENKFYIKKRDINFEATPSWDKITHIRKNGWYNQEWVNENLKKHSNTAMK